MSAALMIASCAQNLRKIRDDYENTGDWWGCLDNAIAYLDSCLAAAPPGMMGGCHADERPKYLKGKP